MLEKIDITDEVRKKYNQGNMKSISLYYNGEKIGFEVYTDRTYDINMRSGYSLKIINPKSYPPKIRIFKEQKAKGIRDQK